jgi:hypothetical protein
MMNDFRFLYIIFLAFAVNGCANPSSDGEYEKVEHFVPAHWPSDLLDASSKIEDRTLQLSGKTAANAPALEGELRDIVGWIPEIAADTELTEEQWDPLYFASEELSKRLAKMPRPLDDATLKAIAEYRNLLSETAKLLPPEEVEEVVSEESLEDTLEESLEDTPSQPVAVPQEEAGEQSR